MLTPTKISLLRHAALWPLVLGTSALLVSCGGGSNSEDAADQNRDNSVQSQAAADPLASALATGNPKGVTLATVMSATQTLLNSQQTDYAALKQTLFGLNADGTTHAGSLTSLDWNPSHDSSWFTLLDRIQNKVILTSNRSYKNVASATPQVMAVAGTLSTGARYAAFGGNPLGVRGNAAMDQLMMNTVAWLTGRTSFTGMKIVTAHLPGSETYWFPHEKPTRDWFAASYPGITINGVSGATPATQADNLCDGAQLDACLQGVDLLVIGREQGPNAYDGAQVMKAVLAAQSRGIPVLYLHHYRDANDLAGRLLDHFGLSVTNNYWEQNGLSAYNPVTTLPVMPNQLDAVLGLVNRLDQGSFTSTWSGCVASVGRVRCAADSTYMAEFGTPADTLRAALRALDASNTAIFSRSGYQLEKLLVLLGDKYRETVSYPMSKLTSGAAFYRAYFSDMVSYMHRPDTSVALNLGNFSGPVPSATKPAAISTRPVPVSVPLPLTGTRDYMTGLYVLPGRTVTLTRSDTGTGAVRFGINMLRDTTWVFNEPTGLDRPTWLASPRSALASKQTVSITSPYGGMLFLHVDASATGAQTATVQISGVTTHPVLRNVNDPAQVAAFTAQIKSTATNWVGVTTDMLTLHSTLAKFNASVASYSGDLAKMIGDTWIYTIKDTYELAGFNSATAGTFTLKPEVAAFCSANAWDCTGTQHRRDVMQHVISDSHAACGNGCSGNPYDQDWAFTPLGWGETHEIGHNLQRGRLKIYAGQSGEVSNNIFPVHKRTQYNLTPAGLAAPLVDRAGSALDVFNTIKTALGTASPSTAVYTSIWSDTAYAANNSARVMFYRQLVEHARYYNSARLGDGWALFTLMHLLDRNFDANSTNWAAVAAKFGFSTYTAQPTDMSGNDFMLISSSFLIGLDMRPMFDMWGVTYSAAAGAQVAAYGYAAVPQVLFPMSQISQIPARVGAPIMMTTSAIYPVGY